MPVTGGHIEESSMCLPVSDGHDKPILKYMLAPAGVTSQADMVWGLILRPTHSCL